MVKHLTKLINNTDKELPIYEQSSNGALTRVTVLRPKHVPTTTPTTTDVHAKHDPTTTPATNYVSENSRSTQEINSYVYSVDPNDSYATIRIWCGKQAVLSVTCEEVIDNRTITIEFKDGEFRKQYEPRNEKKKPASTSGKPLQPPLSSKYAAPTSEAAASTSEGNASSKKDLLGDFLNIFRPHKSADSNAGK